MIPNFYPICCKALFTLWANRALCLLKYNIYDFMPTDDHSVCKIAWINFTSTTPQQEEVIIFHSFHLDTTWEHPLKHTLSLLLKLGMIITIRISLHWTRLSTAAAHKASRADKSHAYNKGLLEFFFPRSTGIACLSLLIAIHLDIRGLETTMKACLVPMCSPHASQYSA